MMRRRLKHLLIATSIALVTAAAPPPVAAAPEGCSTIEALDVRAEARRSSYRIGQTALVDVWVTDRFTGLPEPGAHSGIVLEPRHKKKFVIGAGRTDDRGHVLIRLKLTDDGRVKPGKTKAIAAAWEPYRTPLYCSTERHGYTEYDNLFRIRR